MTGRTGGGGSGADRPLRRLKFLARAGYASRGVVYLIVGSFACLAAFGPAGRKDSEGALLTLLGQPFGRALVALMVAGLGGYVGWRLVQSLLDTDDHGWSPKGIVVRGGLLGSAASHAVLALYALSLLGVLGAAGSDESSGRSLADTIAGYVGLTPVLVVLCLTFAGVAVAHWKKALTRRYADHFDASARVMRFVHPISIAGLLSRGTVWAVLAFLVLLRFRDGPPVRSEPPGLREALGYIQDLPTGRWLLAVTGVGLILFAAYSFSEAIWRRINVEDAG